MTKIKNISLAAIRAVIAAATKAVDISYPAVKKGRINIPNAPPGK